MAQLKTIRSTFFKVVCLIILSQYSFAQVLDLESTTEGLLLPRMTTVERTAIASPSQSEIVYDINTKSFWFWEDMQWNEINNSDTPFLNSGVGLNGGTINNTLPPIKDTITLTSTALITDKTHVSICIDIDHTYVGDLDIKLISPGSGVTLDLTSDNGHSGDNYKRTCFSATAESSITSITSLDAPFTGVYLPEQSLAGLIGQAINGDWTLEVTDDAGGDNGIFNSWELNISNSFAIVAQKALIADYSNIATNAKQLSDKDGDTKIQVEEYTDDDIIKFNVGGTEFLKLSKSPSSNLLIEPINSNNNVFIGHDAGFLSTGNSNVSLGPYAGQKLTTGSDNTLIGRGAGQDIFDKSRNTFVGRWAGRNNLGQLNVYVGDYSGEKDTLGAGNSFFGSSSGLNSKGVNNVLFGISSGNNNDGNGNSFFGSSSGANSQGNQNVFLGLLAGQSNQGSNNIMIGAYAGQNNIGDNKLYIDNSSTSNPLIFGDFSTNMIRINGRQHINEGSAFFGEDSGALPATYGKGVRVYIEETTSKGRVFAYDYGASAPIDLVLQEPGGNVAIGNSLATGYRLSVDGKVACEEVLVEMSGDWPDYVFQDDYKLISIPEVETFIKNNGHLPNVPSAKEVALNGIQVGEMNKILMEKVEELTLYIIELEKKYNSLDERLNK